MVESLPQSEASHKAQSAAHFLQDEGSETGENQDPEQSVAQIASGQSTGGDGAGSYESGGDDQSRSSPRPYHTGVLAIGADWIDFNMINGRSKMLGAGHGGCQPVLKSLCSLPDRCLAVGSFRRSDDAILSRGQIIRNPMHNPG